MTANLTGEAEFGSLRLQFDRSVKLAFQGSSISSDGGLLLHREPDDALGLTDMAVALIGDPRTGQNGRHHFAGLLRQSVSSRLAGYEDVNDAERLRRDPVTDTRKSWTPAGFLTYEGIQKKITIISSNIANKTPKRENN